MHHKITSALITLPLLCLLILAGLWLIAAQGQANHASVVLFNVPSNENPESITRANKKGSHSVVMVDNGDFETGDFSNWTTGGELPQSVTSNDTLGGTYAALLGNPEWGIGHPDSIPAGKAYIEQEVHIPSSQTPTLSFWYRVTSYDVLIGSTTGRIWDSLDVTINGVKEKPIFRTGNPDGAGVGPPVYDSGWAQAVVDLSAYRGKIITLRFAVWNREYDNPPSGLDWFNTWAYVDNIIIVEDLSSIPTPALTLTPTITPTSTKTSTPTPTLTPTPLAEDPYEPDNACAQAGTIATDGTIQTHNFHQQADDDWVTFQVTQGMTYTIEARVPPSSRADLMVEVSEGCNRLPELQAHPFTPDVRYEIVPESDGQVYVHLFNERAAVYGADVTYDLSVRAEDGEAQHGALIIVAGKYKDDDPLQENIHNVSNEVYQLFLRQGHPAEQIYYLATEQQDPDGDGNSEVNQVPTSNNLKAAITKWAAQHVGPNQALTLFMMDHGSYDKLYLDETRRQRVSPSELDAWLSELEGQTGAKVNVIIEACQAGSFIDPKESLSKEGRVVMAATDAYAPSYASNDGAYFSDALFSALAQGKSLKAAFDEANDSVSQHPIARAQRPWIDSDGNAIPNQPSDNAEAERRGFAITGSFPTEQWAPYIRDAEIRNFESTKGQIWTDVLDDQGVNRLHVWAVVYPPSYDAPTSSEEIVPALRRLTLAEISSTKGQYGAEYDAYRIFNEIGQYRIVIYAEDDDGLLAHPKVLTLETGSKLYLPLLLR